MRRSAWASMAGGQTGAVSVREAAQFAAGRLAACGIPDARREAWLLLAAATGRARADLLAASDDALTLSDVERLEEFVERRRRREPIAYILGEKEFWSLPLRVSPAVLIPRPETETVVEAALAGVRERKGALRILDLGTGSGCLLLALLSELPAATGLGVDASEAALDVARTNAGRLGLEARANFRRGDWGRALTTSFDLIVSNPPYIREQDWAELALEIRAHEPATALLAGGDGLDAYRALAPDLARLLAPGGRGCLEIGQGQAAAVAGILRAAGLEVLEARKDLAGIERCVTARLLNG